jgi:hypothetical protein
MRRSVLQEFLALLMLIGGDASAVERWVVGNMQHPWKDAAWEEPEAVKEADWITDPGWLRPDSTGAEENLSLKARDRGGGVSSPQPSVQLLGNMEAIIDGNKNTAFEMTIEGYFGAFLILDLGGVFPVNRMTFYPTETHKTRFIRGYEIALNDGTEVEGVPVWRLAAVVRENRESLVNVRLPFQYVRRIMLTGTSIVVWEISELEVYGQGFVPKAVYTSKVIDIGGIANFGKVVWNADVDREASVTLVTRTGSTQDPFAYYELVPKGLDTLAVKTTKERYDKLDEKLRRKVPDTQNWSAWSAPYPLSGDGQFLSPGPRRYVQFRIDLFSDSFTDRARVDSVAILYSKPPVAHRVVAEISPGEVPAGKVTRFTYALRPEIRDDDTGFDALEILTPVEVDPATIRDLKIGGLPVGDLSREVEADRFRVYFPQRIRTDGTLVELTFDCPVLVYGTIFGGTVFDSRTSDFHQSILPGNATPDIGTDGLAVKVSLGGGIISGVEVSPNPFTPNGDGVSDRAFITYNILKLLDPAPVEVSVYDLSGTLVWKATQNQTNGLYSVIWDGRNSTGKTVSPGGYLYRIAVRTHTGEDSRGGTIVVVY